jgi:hypothetical protein
VAIKSSQIFFISFNPLEILLDRKQQQEKKKEEKKTS